MKHRALFALALVALAAFGLASCADERAPASHARAPETRAQSQGPAGPARRRAALEVRATFRLQVPSADRTAALARELSALTEASGGYVESASLGDDRLTRLVLRVPPDQIASLRRVLARAAGREALHEELTSTDVTEALADLDARLRTHRAAEARLLALLEQRTGALADVLAVERSLVEVRERIERLEAEQRGAQGRVDLATVTVQVERVGDLLSAPLGRQAAEALHDGVTAARVLLLGLLLGALRALPALLVIAAPIALAWRLLRKKKP
jgi:hypothetical protein